MKAIGLHEFGGPDVLRVLELPEPRAGRGEVRIRVHAAAVNATDALLRIGGHAVRMPGVEPPFIPGMDAAGVIDDLGPDVAPRLSAGQEVIAIVPFTGRHGGAYAEQVVVPAASVVAAPSGIPLTAASTVPMNALTARLALDTLALPRGAHLAITGAAGAVGGYAVQLARADGLTVLADAAPHDRDFVAGLGAHHVVERGPGVAARLRDLAPEGVPGLIDGSVQTSELLPALADGGTLVELRGWGGPAERGIRVRPIMTSDVWTDTGALDTLARQVEAGVLTPRVHAVLRPEQAAHAHRLLAAGGLRGRVVLDFS
ncbi:alcohol dehydrogenase catalytic domain-containing protein [Actinokineospora bangkokensis]|uniref:Alcohol dehydrogenase n=1 Tax=Actinokineospora bangkokensis TaxID=1193682 RepID=A0A1Q9LKQ7_9PSEU|nr:zinc-binding dehydrogenase [Actinokineospora bangkokensis]OLR92631.1 alcohol dehydrogenase [Actinokineospora bangkokensis]